MTTVAYRDLGPFTLSILRVTLLGLMSGGDQVHGLFAHRACMYADTFLVCPEKLLVVNGQRQHPYRL